MKNKILLGVVTFGMCLVISVCGKKSESSSSSETKTINSGTLECTYTDNDEYKTSITTYLNYDSKKGEFVDGTASLAMTIPESVISTYNESDLCKVFSQNMSKAYENCNASIDGNNVYFKFSLNITELENDKDSTFKKKSTLEDTKKEIEKDGSTCVIR